jgi:hypothetical protein
MPLRTAPAEPVKERPFMNDPHRPSDIARRQRQALIFYAFAMVALFVLIGFTVSWIIAAFIIVFAAVFGVVKLGTWWRPHR